MYTHQSTEFLPKLTYELGIMIGDSGGQHAMVVKDMVKEKSGYLQGSVSGVTGNKVD